MSRSKLNVKRESEYRRIRNEEEAPSRLGAVYAERRLDSPAVVGRDLPHIPGLWSLERDDVVVTLLGELVDGLSAEEDGR